MVSRTPKKKTPKKTKSGTKRTGRRNKTKTPEKFNASSCSIHLTSTIHDSFYTCRRQLSKIFTKLVHIATPSPTSKPRHRTTPKTKTKKTGSPTHHHHRCFPRKFHFPNFKKGRVAVAQDIDLDNDPSLIDGETQALIANEDSSRVRRPLYFNPLPPLPSSLKGTIFLDLDETLIHSIPDPPPDQYDFMVSPVIDGELLNFYVVKRPGAEELLRFLKSRGFEVVVFTAGLREYASPVVDQLDRDRVLISHRLYRDECKHINGRYVKDLSELGRDLSRVVIVDDNPGSYLLQMENGVRVKAFVDDEDDRECWKLMGFFDWCLQFDDFREAVRVFEDMDLSHSER